MTEKQRIEMQTEDPLIDRIQRLALIVGVIAVIVAITGIFVGGVEQFFHSYLFAYLFWFGLAAGCFAIALLHYLVGGNWGFGIRRVVEAGSKTLWFMALLFIPISIGLSSIYPWARPGAEAQYPVLQKINVYLNPPFFLLRTAFYFAVWIVFTVWLTRWSRYPETVFDSPHRRRFQRLSAFGLMIYILTMTFASVDWIMSLQPGWYSTIYGMLTIASQALVGFAFAVAVLPTLFRRLPPADLMTPGLYRDLGALLLTTVMFWAYLGFSQFLIIWSGNLPREVIWYVDRTQGGWIWFGIFVVLVQFFLPFLVLLSLRAKRSARVLSILGAGIVVTNLVNIFWEITPAFHPGGVFIHWLDFVIPIAIGGLWIAVFLWHYKRTPMLILPEERVTDIIKSEEHQSSYERI